MQSYKFNRYAVLPAAGAILASIPVCRFSFPAGLLLSFVGAGVLWRSRTKRPLVWIFLGIFLTLTGATGLLFSRGVLLFLHAWVVVVLGTYVLLDGIDLMRTDRERFRNLGINTALVLGTVLLVFALMEGTLVLVNRLLPPPRKPSLASLWRPIPAKWAMRMTCVPGAEMAYYWHGVLHYHDITGMRRIHPLTPKPEGVFRIAVIGDSYTYGEGVAIDSIYPTLIQRKLSEDYNVDVINMGVRGYDIASIRKNLLNYFYLIEPDLVIYGVCLNDYAISPFDAREIHFTTYTGTPWTFLCGRTLSVPFLQVLVNKAMLACNLKRDFYEDVLVDFEQKRSRYVFQARALNEAVVASGHPPVVALVIEQCPRLEGPSRDLAVRTEETLAGIGMTVIPSEAYYRANAGASMIVSPWENHPNEQAHRIFADQFLSYLKSLPELQKYRR